MKILIMTVFLLTVAWQPVQAVEEAAANQVSVVIKKENESTFKGLLYKVWGKLRALNPQLNTRKTSDRGVATMGIRGSETTTSIIEPYWKGDKTDDEEYIVELTKYTRAQQFAEDGELKKAVTELNAFIEKYSDSELMPNAQFALGISQGGMGDVVSSKATLKAFINDYPKHPLVEDARAVIDSL